MKFVHSGSVDHFAIPPALSGAIFYESSSANSNNGNGDSARKSKIMGDDLSNTDFAPSNQDEVEAEIAFRYAVQRINRDRNILPNTTLVYEIQVSLCGVQS